MPSPASLQYGSRSPAYSPVSPGYSPTSPIHFPGNDLFNPPSPIRNPNPSWSPVSPAFMPTNPPFHHPRPVQGQSPAWIPASAASIPEDRPLQPTSPLGSFSPSSPVFNPHSSARQPLAPVTDLARLNQPRNQRSLSPAYSPTSPPPPQCSPPTIAREKSLTPLLDYEDYESPIKSPSSPGPASTLESQVWPQPGSFSSKRNASHFDEDDNQPSQTEDDLAVDGSGSHRSHKARKTRHSSSSVTLHDDDAYEHGDAGKGTRKPAIETAFMHKAQTSSARKSTTPMQGSPHRNSTAHLTGAPLYRELQRQHDQAKNARRQSATASRIPANLKSTSVNKNPRSAPMKAANPPTSILLPSMVYNPYDMPPPFPFGHVGHKNRTNSNPTPREEEVAGPLGGDRCGFETGSSSEFESSGDGAFGSSSSESGSGSSEFWSSSSGSSNLSRAFGVGRDDLANAHNESPPGAFNNPTAPTPDNAALPSFAAVAGESNDNPQQIRIQFDPPAKQPIGSIADELRQKMTSTGPPNVSRPFVGSGGKVRGPIPRVPRLIIPNHSINQPVPVSKSKEGQGSTLPRTEQNPNGYATIANLISSHFSQSKRNDQDVPIHKSNYAQGSTFPHSTQKSNRHNLKHQLDSSLVPQSKRDDKAASTHAEKYGQGATFPKSAQNPNGYNAGLLELAREYVRRCEGGGD